MDGSKTNLLAQGFPRGSKHWFSSEKISFPQVDEDENLYRVSREIVRRNVDASKFVLIYFRKNLPLGYE